MNRIKLPEFITFKNFNDEAIGLISKKELELNKLYSISCFKKFLKIFETYPNLKLLNLSVEEITIGESKNYLLSNVSSTFIDSSVYKEEHKIFDSLCNILGYDHMLNIYHNNGIIVGREINSFNKLKSIFGIDNLSDKDIKKTIKISDFLLKEEIENGFDDIYWLKNEILIMSILNLFKNNNNLEKINLLVDNSKVNSSLKEVNVSFFDRVSDSDDCIIIKEIKDIIGDKRLYHPDCKTMHDLEMVEVGRWNVLDIRNFIKYVFQFEGPFKDFSVVMEHDMLEENIAKSVVGIGKKNKI